MLTATLSVFCGGPSGEDVVDNDSTITDQGSPTLPPNEGGTLSHVIVGEARWPTLDGDSLQSMVEAYDTIVVGSVVEAALTTPAPTEAPESTEPLPSEHPKAGANASNLSAPPESVYTVEVSRVIEGDRVSEGGRIRVFQRGGIVDGVAYEIEGDPTLEVGRTYLFFLRDFLPSLGEDVFSGSPFGRFLVTEEDRLSAVDNSWSRMSAVEAISGKTVDEAVAAIEVAVLETAASAAD